MGSPLALRTDYDSNALRHLSKRCSDTRQVRRLLSLAVVYDGMSRTEAARVGGMDRQTLRDWGVRFNNEGPDGLTDRPRLGGISRLTDAQLTKLRDIVEIGPDLEMHGIVRWRCVDLQKVVCEQFGVTYSERGISSASGPTLILAHHRAATAPRPRPSSHCGFQENLGHILKAHIGHLPKCRKIEVWFQDEACIGKEERRRTDLSKAGDQVAAACRPTLSESLSLRGHLLNARKGRWPCTASRRHRRHATVSRRDQPSCGKRQPWCPVDGSRWMASDRKAQRTRKSDYQPAATTLA